MELTSEQQEYLRQHREQLERKALFAVCVSKAHLHSWIKRYLGINLPDTIICDDDTTTVPSNSSPMDLIWEVYQKALDGNDEKFQRVLAYAARDSFKTLSASILEILCLFHLRRDVAHMAAIEAQAQKAASYVQRYLQRPYLKEFVVGNNKREIRVVRYEDTQGNILTPREFEALEIVAQRPYEPISNYMKIIIATLAGANSEHVSFMVLDELDLAPAGPVEESKMIPAPGQVRGELPITFMTSTRKFAIGLVQAEIDKAAKDKDYHLQIRHWNVIDVTRKCAPERHLPDEPKIPIFYSENTLKAIPKDDYDLLANEEKGKYFEAEGYTGCLKNCSLFAVCRGRLATKQKADDPNEKPRSMLKPIPHVITQFKSVDPSHAKAQLMCWKPSSEGLIYQYFNYSRHMIDAAEMFEKLTGEEIPKDKLNAFTKADLIRAMIERGCEFHTGMDWGYTHNWAAVTGAKDGNRFFVFDCISVPELETMQKIEMYKEKWGFLDASVWPDPEDPASIATFRRHGIRMKKFNKGKGSVLGGIESVRAKLMPGLNKEPEIFFLANDEGCELLAQRLAKYSWMLDANQKPTDIPNDNEDDECDALRYIIMNLFGMRGKFVAAVAGLGAGVHYDPNFPMPRDAADNGAPPGIAIYQQETIQEPTAENFLEHKIKELTNDHHDETAPRTGRKGRFIFDI